MEWQIWKRSAAYVVMKVFCSETFSMKRTKKMGNIWWNTVEIIHMWASQEVCAGVHTLLCILHQLIKHDQLKEERMWRMWLRSESPYTSKIPWRKEAWRLDANLDYLTGATKERCDECDFKPGVRTVWSIIKKWNMNDFNID